MKASSPTRQLSPPPLGQFQEFVRKIVSVPKAEIDKQEAAYRRKRKAHKQKRLSRPE
jgi:hypothetical protein